MMRLLRRFGFTGEDQRIRENTKWLRQRQKNQLSLLNPLKNHTEPSLLNKKIEQLQQSLSQEVFNTFATRCLRPEISSLNALADVNIQRVLQKGSKKIPFTVKDHLKVEGLIQTCGFSDNKTPSNYSSDVVALLEQQNCIAFAHSNIPQGLLGIQSSNQLYGTSLNPHNPSFLSGGSSGGQGALVASKACAFGIGSDSGGSIRIPAAFNGVFGFKPTGSKRLSLKGRVGTSGGEGLKVGDLDPCMGFLTRQVDDIAWLCSKTIGKTILGPELYGGQWDNSRYQAAKRKKLRVGYIYKNSQMKVAPGLINTLNETLDELTKNKHKVVEFQFTKLSEFRNFFFQFVHNTGFLNPIYTRMEGHLTAPQLQQFYDLKLFGQLGLKIKHQYIADPYVKQLYSIYTKQQTTAQFLKMHKKVDDLRKQFWKEWRRLDIDVLLSPTTPFTAPLPGSTELLVYQLTFCAFQNILELPAGVVPTRLVKADETKYDAKTIFERVAEPAIRGSQGLPLAVQVTGQHLMDEQCLGAMWQIQRLNGHYLEPKFKNN